MPLRKFPDCHCVSCLLYPKFCTLCLNSEALPGHSILSNFLPDKVQNPVKPCQQEQYENKNYFHSIVHINEFGVDSCAITNNRNRD